MGTKETPGKWKKHSVAYLRLLALPILTVTGWARADEPGLEFFENKVRPVLVEHCYNCHSARAKKIKGGLRLDVKAGWQTGGDSGKPAIVPGKPDDSRLIRAIRHDKGEEAMPPSSKLPDRVIADLVAWVKMGAPDPRVGKVEIPRAQEDWEAIYQNRLKWWTFVPITLASRLRALRHSLYLTQPTRGSINGIANIISSLQKGQKRGLDERMSPSPAIPSITPLDLRKVRPQLRGFVPGTFLFGQRNAPPFRAWAADRSGRS